MNVNRQHPTRIRWGLIVLGLIYVFWLSWLIYVGSF